MSLYNGASLSNFREYPNDARFNVATQLTIAIWVNPASAPSVQWVWAGRGPATVSGEWTASTPGATTFNVARASIVTTSGIQTAADPTPWVNKRWFHFCQTYDGTTLRLYVDGKEKANSVPAGSYTQTSTAPIRLWMRPSGTQGPCDSFIEQFGWWRTAFTPQEVEYLARGGDFTKVRREDALILDRLRNFNEPELVAGLGTNTGTISFTEPAPIIYRRPNVTLARPLMLPTATRKSYDNASIVVQDVGWQSNGVVPTRVPKRAPTMDVPQPAGAVSLLKTGWEPAAPNPTERTLPNPQASVSADVAGAGSPAILRTTGFEPPAPSTLSPRGKVGVNFDGPMRAFLSPSGWEPLSPWTLSPRGHTAAYWDGPLPPFLAPAGIALAPPFLMVGPGRLLVTPWQRPTDIPPIVLFAGGWEPNAPAPQSPRGKMGVNFDLPPLLPFLYPGGWEPLGPRTKSTAGKAGWNFDGPMLAFLAASGWEPYATTVRRPRAQLPGMDPPAPASVAPLLSTGWEPAAPSTMVARSGRLGSNWDGPLVSFFYPSGWEPPAPRTASPRGKAGINFDGAGLLAQLGLSGWEPFGPQTLSPRGRGAVNFDGPFIPFLFPTGWEPGSPTTVSPRGRIGTSFDGALLFATLAATGWEPAAPFGRRPRAPWPTMDAPYPAFSAALLSTGWEPSSPRTQSPHGAPGANFDGWTAFGLRSAGFEPPSPWTASPRGKAGISFEPKAAPTGTVGVTGWEPPGPFTVSPRGKLAPTFDGPMAALLLAGWGWDPASPQTRTPRPGTGVGFSPLASAILAASGWEPSSPVTHTPRPGIGVCHDPFLTVVVVLGPVGWESTTPRPRGSRGAFGSSADAGILVPPRPVTGWEPGSPYLPRTPRPGVGVNFDGPLAAFLSPTGWEPESPRTHSPRGLPGPNYTGPWLAFLRATGWEPEAPRTHTPRPGLGGQWSGPMIAFLGPTGWEPAQPLGHHYPPGWGHFSANLARIAPPSIYEFIYGPPSIVQTADSQLAPTTATSRTIPETADSEADQTVEKSRTIVILSSS